MNLSNISKKERELSRNNINSTANDNCFNILKKSFGSRKSRTKSKVEASGTNSFDTSLCKENPITSNNINNSYFTDEFLDSVTSKTMNRLFSTNCFKSRLKTCRPEDSLNSEKKTSDIVKSICNKPLIESNGIENILLIVIEDYINTVCEKILQDKMKYAYGKMQNWYRNPLTRPGFKKINQNTGGNVTKPERYFVQQNSLLIPKKENYLSYLGNKKKELSSKSKNQEINNIEKSSNINNMRCNKYNRLTYSRKYLSSDLYLGKPSSDNIIKNEIQDSSEIEVRNCSQSNSFKNKLNKTNPMPGSNTKVLSIKCSKYKPEETTKNINSLSGDDVIPSKLNLPLNNTNEYKNESVYKCTNTLKYPIKDQNIKKYDNSKTLNICKIVNINISPLNENSNKISDIKSKEENEEKKLSIFDGVEQSIYKIPRSIKMKEKNNRKIKRSVTFLEPRNSEVNSPLRKNLGFLSNLDMRSSGNFSNIYSTKSEELNCYSSTNTLTSDQNKTELNADMFNLKYRNHLYKTQISNLRKDNYENFNTKNCNNFQKKNCQISRCINKDCKSESNFPIVVSLNSSPSLSDNGTDDVKEKSLTYNSVNTHDNFTTNSNKTNSVFGELCDENKNKICKVFETEPKIQQNNGQNYSIIEIVKKKKFQGDGNISPEMFFNKQITDKTITIQNESVTSSSKSSINNGDLDKLKSENGSLHLTVQQEVVMTEEDSSCEDYISQPSFKPSLISTQIKTANFSSSSLMHETQTTLASTLKEKPSSYLCTVKTKKTENDVINPITARLCPKKPKQNININQKLLNTKQNHNENSSNIFRHTVSSRQKCRGKVLNKIEIFKHPMKF